uniref:ISAzo13-like element transposase-related protein n=1 Tax=Streptomyces fildesensis TaxID=375757 RepID=UPI003F6841B3
MNWRGRPLTSHEVVVNTIAATRTRTGLRVDAVLDTGDYPVGVSVSRERMSALPITPHAERGKWNYTIGPAATGTKAAVGIGERDRNRSAALHTLADPRLTGMSRGNLKELAASLAPAQAARAEQRYFEQRGGRRRQVKGSHGRPLLTDADRVLIAVVYLRQVCSQVVLSELLEVSTGPIAAAVVETGKLLAKRKHGIEPTVLRFTSATALRGFLATDIVPTRPNRLATLGDPALTGMSRQELAKLIGRLSLHQAAEAERRKHRQRGADRQFGARGGIFSEKITDAERVLATILSLRKVCSRDVVADLFQVSRRTIGNAVLWVRPLLDQDGYTATRSKGSYSTAADLLSAIAEHEGNRDAPISPR